MKQKSQNTARKSVDTAEKAVDRYFSTGKETNAGGEDLGIPPSVSPIIRLP